MVIIPAIIIGVLVGALLALLITEEIENHQIKKLHKEKAGHEAAFTRVKKHYEMAKKIIRRGR